MLFSFNEYAKILTAELESSSQKREFKEAWLIFINRGRTVNLLTDTRIILRNYFCLLSPRKRCPTSHINNNSNITASREEWRRRRRDQFAVVVQLNLINVILQVFWILNVHKINCIYLWLAHDYGIKILRNIENIFVF